MSKWGWFIATGVAVGTWLKLRKAQSSSETSDELLSDYDNFNKEWTADEKATPAYQKLLQKWGTPEEVIDVKYGEGKTKKERKRLQDKKLNHIEATALALAQTQKDKLQEFPKLNAALSDFEITQVTVTNTTNSPQITSLWGGNRPSLQASILEDSEQDISVGIAPVVVNYNPFNSHFYIVNQLSETVQVVDSKGREIHLFELRLPGDFIGGISPVAITIIDDINSPYYGYAYVVGSISNHVYELTPQFEIGRIFTVGRRPVSIGFDKRLQRLLVANLQEHTISSIDLEDSLVSEFASIGAPRTLIVHPITDEVYAFTKALGAVSIFSSSGDELHTFNNASEQGFFIYFPPLEEVLFLNPSTKLMIRFDAVSHIAQTFTANYDFEFAIYQPTEKQLLLASKEASFFEVYDEVLEPKGTFPKSQGANLFSISNDGNVLLEIDNQLSNGIVQISQSTPAVTFNSGYEATLKDFQHNPAILRHLKIINQGDLHLNTVKFISKSVTGKESIKMLSIRNYDSPQHFSKVSEIMDVEGIAMDGRNRWEFTLPPNARVTFLLYHLQYDTYNLLPETARKSIGVTMSKGLLNQKIR